LAWALARKGVRARERASQLKRDVTELCIVSLAPYPAGQSPILPYHNKCGMSKKNDSFLKATETVPWSATPGEQRAYRSLQSRLSRIARFCARVQNALIDLTRWSHAVQSSSPELNEILHRARTRTDISDHLPTLFAESLSLQPRLIVELGVRGGESTFVFERVARLSGARCVSVDIEESSCANHYHEWLFVQSDDIKFAKEFPAWCCQNGLPTEIDILFIDTSHFFEHTVQEIEHWFPLLAPCAKVIFHDTNQRRIYFRKDGSMGVGWNNRGVMAALERYFNQSFNEKEDFIDLVNGWLIRHYANCSGLTTLTRVAFKSGGR
jgi:cephalosporin hydroxylase